MAGALGLSPLALVPGVAQAVGVPVRLVQLVRLVGLVGLVGLVRAAPLVHGIGP